MYRAPREDEDLRFGDIVEAEWIFDVHLREDARPLNKQTVCGSVSALLPEDRSAVTAERHAPRDLVMAHANVSQAANRAVIVSDDCDIADAIESPQGRRLTLAALTPLDADEGVRAGQLVSDAFDRFPIAPQEADDFAGGIIRFQRVCAVAAKELLALKPVLTIASEQDRQSLRMRWNAHSARHGPLVVAQAALDLVKLLMAGGDRERAKELRATHRPDMAPEDAALIDEMKALAALNWALEGGTVDSIADALSHGRHPDEIVGDVVELMERISSASGSAAGSLRDALARRRKT